MTQTASRIEFPEGGAAVICRSSFNKKWWIICREFGNRIESDEIAAKRGHFRTSGEAEAYARSQSAKCTGICSW